MFENININVVHEYLTLLDDNKSDELTEIMSKYDSDKGYGICNKFIEHGTLSPNGVCHNYTHFYNLLLSPYRNNPITIFEMGVGVPSVMGSWAGSLKGWEEYFPNGTIFSADFDRGHLYNSKRIKSFYVDQENESSIIDLWKNNEMIDIQFDLMIDDGPHTYTSNYNFYTNSINKLKSNGIYIVEDIHLDFIDKLITNITNFNQFQNIIVQIEKLIIPWPKKYSHPDKNFITKMNNLLFIKKL